MNHNIYTENEKFSPQAWKLLMQYRLSPELFVSKERVSEEDIEAYIQAHEVPLPQPLSPIQQVIIKNVSEAAKKPVYRIYDGIDATLLRAHETKKLTLTVWILKLIAEAMMQNPSTRMTLDTHTYQLWPNASISLAMAHGEALYMPVFKDVNKKSAPQIAEELKAYKERVRSGRVLAANLIGSTFGISNLGMTGIERFDALVNRNDTGIAAIGSEKQGQISVTLTIDHRFINGWQAAEFMQTIKRLAEDPEFYKGAIQ
ncbi:2-oxo acid dehydrogenase subunit E2 [Hydrogenimonas urashimensis]|uniref:2-oxo acid dehydrogenase subunit E2 n=1 Tax=Hydrogenimonas urashimensis TaxID=2740515 RepID=UPI0019169127|nr:2-oxo acid dehydrogenase subunit E2 [Hydrogenimonas urashimensis]